MNKTLLLNILQEYLKETMAEVRKRALQGEGKSILGDVINRPDDVEIEIDRVGEHIIKKLLEDHHLNAIIFSEPENGEIRIGGEPEFYGALDPFDNSVLFLKEFQHTWYTVLSFFAKDRTFLCGGIGDILDEKIWISDGRKGVRINLKNKKKTLCTPSSRKTLEEEVTLASYVMASPYSLKFFDIFGDLIKHMSPRALLYPYGGSHIYGYLADGRVDAYLMFDEPRSEIDPGFAIAKAAGCQIGEVDKAGNWEDYEFIPGKQHDKVDVFIAAATPELRDQIIRYYIAQKNR